MNGGVPVSTKIMMDMVHMHRAVSFVDSLKATAIERKSNHHVYLQVICQILVIMISYQYYHSKDACCYT